MYGFYPLPNRTPDDVFSTNNFEASTVQTVRRHSSNNRVDFRWKNHSIYGSGGISYAEIVTPRPFGTAPFNDAPAIRADKNPYIQLGDAVVLSPTLVLDVRYGMARVKTDNLNGNKTGFTDYASFGVPDNLLPYMLYPGAAPAVTPNGYGGGNGGGSNWSGLSAGTFGSQREFQANHSVTGSLTKTRGKWVHKAGVELPQPDVELRRSGTGVGRHAVAVRASGRELQLRVRHRQRRRCEPDVHQRAARRQRRGDAARNRRVVDPSRR